MITSCQICFHCDAEQQVAQAVIISCEICFQFDTEQQVVPQRVITSQLRSGPHSACSKYAIASCMQQAEGNAAWWRQITACLTANHCTGGGAGGRRQEGGGGRAYETQATWCTRVWSSALMAVQSMQEPVGVAEPLLPGEPLNTACITSARPIYHCSHNTLQNRLQLHQNAKSAIQVDMVECVVQTHTAMLTTLYGCCQPTRISFDMLLLCTSDC